MPYKCTCKNCQTPWITNSHSRPIYCSLACRLQWERANTGYYAILLEMLQHIPEDNVCLVWPFHCNAAGYGTVVRDGKQGIVSHFAYEAAFGAIPEGLFACHHCDNPPCFRPSHLFAGDNSDNMQDSIAKGRFTRSHGERHWKASVTEETVREIRRLHAEGMSTRAIEARFGLGDGHAWRIVARKQWTHI